MNEPVIIDEEFENLFPPLKPDEYSKLEMLCKRDGIQCPLRTWNGILVDGHNRYKISEEWDLNYEVKELEDCHSREEAKQWAIDNQIARRNLTKSQLVEVYAKYESSLKKEAEAKMLSGKKDPSSNLNEGTNPIRTAAEVAKKIGVGENTYRAMVFIKKNGTQEQIDRMDKKITVPKKSNAVSTIKKEIKDDQEIVKTFGTEEQKERLEIGGIGNKPSEIAEEIKKEGMSVIGESLKTCTKCHNKYPSSYFEPDRSTCKYCRSIRRTGKKTSKKLRDVKGNKIEPTGEYENVSDTEIVNRFYSNEKPKEITIFDVIEEFKENFTASIDNLKSILQNYSSIISENKSEFSKAWDDIDTMFESLRKEYNK